MSSFPLGVSQLPSSCLWKPCVRQTPVTSIGKLRKEWENRYFSALNSGGADLTADFTFFFF